MSRFISVHDKYITVVEDSEAEEKSKRIVIKKGGPGSGHHGHAGRPGKIGGSAPGKGGSESWKITEAEEQAQRFGMLPNYERNYDENWGKEPGTYVAYRATLDPNQLTARGSYFAPQEMDAEPYVFPGSKSKVYKYEITVDNPFIGKTKSDATLLLFGEKHIPMLENMAYKHGIDNLTANRELDAMIMEGLSKLGYDSMTLTIPQPPATREIVIFEEGLFIVEKSKRIRVIKGGPGSGHHGHAGRPGKVGGSAPGKGAGVDSGDYEDFELRIKLVRYEDKGPLGNQGSQSHARLLELDDGTLAVHKVYGYSGDQAMGTNDAVAYELAQALGVEEVPMAMELHKDESVQKFVDGSVTLYMYKYGGGKIKGEQLDEAMLFDILIGNTDRHGDNMLVHEESGRIFLIDNSYSLGDSYMLKGAIGVKSDVAGSIDGVVSSYKRKASDTAKSLTLNEWKGFESKARSGKVRNIIMDRYGEFAGNVIHDSMMLRMDVFKDKYEEFLQ